MRCAYGTVTETDRRICEMDAGKPDGGEEDRRLPRLAGGAKPETCRFYEAVGEWAKTFASSQPEHEQTVAAVRLLLFSAGSIWAARRSGI